MNAPPQPAVPVAVAPNGGRRTKADHPALPLTVAELARTAAECHDAGAAMIHLHVRAADGSHSLAADIYRAVIAAIRREVGDRLVVQITSEALGRFSPAEQRAAVRGVRPEAVSLALRELVPDVGEEAPFADLLGWLRREHCTPQIILYAPEDARRLADLQARGLIPWDRIPVLYVLGRYRPGETSTPEDLLPFLAPEEPRFGPWSVCAFGRFEAACVTTAALLGGGVRVGFENNFYRPDGSPAASNAEQVATVRTILESLGRRTCTADALRNLWADG